MLLVRQCVDHPQAGCGVSELLEPCLGERADHRPVDPPLQVSRDVGH